MPQKASVGTASVEWDVSRVCSPVLIFNFIWHKDSRNLFHNQTNTTLTQNMANRRQKQQQQQLQFQQLCLC